MLKSLLGCYRQKNDIEAVQREGNLNQPGL